MVLILTLVLATTICAFGPEFGNEGSPFPGPGFGGPGAFGERPEGPGYFKGGPWSGFCGGPDPARFLNLSTEQKDKVREMRDRHVQETRELRYEFSQKLLEMRKLFTDPKTEEATLLAKQKEVSLLGQKLMDKMAQMIIEGRKILTSEQIQKLDQMPMRNMDFGGM